MAGHREGVCHQDMSPHFFWCEMLLYKRMLGRDDRQQKAAGHHTSELCDITLALTSIPGHLLRASQCSDAKLGEKR